ncbi:MAG TPA: transcriptional repressor LexA [Xanthomonadaceae bacterium]|nr:transcriptional repressor LexA [Xanthomonadaceae bacterium]
MPAPLSPRQQQVLDFIAAHAAAEGRPPTLREIAQALGYRQHSSAQAHIDALARKGWLQRSSAHRGLRLLAGAAGPASGDLLALPLVGRVAAGTPILSEGNIESRYALDRALFRPRPHFLMRVEGMSMRDAGILDGDLVAVHRTRSAENGQIVVARLDEEVTVKRLHRAGDRLLLLPANPDYDPIVVDPRRTDSFAIEGVHVGTIRRG